MIAFTILSFSVLDAWGHSIFQCGSPAQYEHFVLGVLYPGERDLDLFRCGCSFLLLSLSKPGDGDLLLQGESESLRPCGLAGTEHQGARTPGRRSK